MNAEKVQSLCRTCRKKQKIANQVPVKAQDLNGKTVADMIYELTDIAVSFDSHLPQFICPQCLEELRAAHGFRQKCIDSNTILSKLVIPNSMEEGLPEDASLPLVKVENCDPELTDTEDDNLYDLVELNVDMPIEESPNQEKQPVPIAIKKSVLKQNDQSESGTEAKAKRRHYQQIALECMETDGKRYYCTIDESVLCGYSQECFKLQLGNFVRHLRTMHPEAATRRGLDGRRIGTMSSEKVHVSDVEPKRKRPMKKLTLDSDQPDLAKARWSLRAMATEQVQVSDIEPTRKRPVGKQTLDSDQSGLVEACIKLVAMHHLPVRCFEWDGFRMLLDPLAASAGFQIGSANILECVHMAADHLVDQMRWEMSQRLVSVKVDSAMHHGLHYLTVSAQFESNLTVITRVLGVIRVMKSLTVKQLSARILEVLGRYNLSNEQIFAMVVGNEPDMLASAAKLQTLFADTVSVIGDVDTGNAANLETLLDALSMELRGHFNVLRSAVCNLQQIIDGVVSDFDSNIDRISRFVNDVKDPKYEVPFETGKASYPSQCCPNRWDDQYSMVRSIVQQEQFFIALCQKHPELALNESDWKFLRDFNDAFLPLHEVLEVVQKDHQLTFSEFYMRWLLTIKDVRGKADNQFSKPLVESLTRRLVLLKENMVYKAALYLDPRFLYLRSVVLTAEQKEEVQNYIVSIWNRIQSLKPGKVLTESNAPETKQEDNKDDMDDFLTEMFGGPSEGSSKSLVPLSSSVTPVLQQLKGLEIEPRQAHNYDVWNHWLLRANTHPELFAVAMVVLSLPSNNVCLERAFSALVLSDRRDGLSEQALEELLLVRLNRNLFEKVVLTMCDWKQVLGT